jgi:FkbM family methyltransferase
MIKATLKNLAYGLYDLATLKKGISRKINNKMIRFPVRWSRYYEDYYEAANYSFLQKQLKPGMQVMDIGAHIGLFSVYTSQLVGTTGKIICFEPTPGTFAILKRTLKLNHCDNVLPIQAAVADKEGKATFYVGNTAGCNSNSLVENKSKEELSAYDVQLVTIDSIVAQYSFKPELIKIDAEGAELDVLKGGLKTFRELKPVLILGLHPSFIKQKGDSLEAIWDLLKSQQYEITLEDKTLTKESFCSHDLIFDVHCF